jgi:oxygen-independent coproporphyrinogen-3 oxidase
MPTRFKSQRQIKDEDLPTAAQKLTMFSETIAALTAAGYQYIGIDHFAKPDDELAIAQREGKLHRNFQGYTILGDCDLLGFGVSAISQINSTLYATQGRVASHILQNNPDLDSYKAAVNAGRLPGVKHIQTTIKDRLRAYVIMNLLCHDYIDFKDVNQKFGIDAITYFIDDIQQLGEMQKDKLIDMDAAGIRILPKGRLLARNVAMVFDTYMADKSKDRFSKVI